MLTKEILRFLGPCCFNAEGAEVPAEEAEARLAEFALRPLRKPSRPLRLSTPSRLRNLRDVFMRFSKSESNVKSIAYMTQGESFEELADNLRDTHEDLTTGKIPCVRRAELQVA